MAGWKRLIWRSFVPGVKGSLTGYYDLRGDRLTGCVDAGYDSGDGKVFVEAKGDGRVIVGCVAVPDGPWRGQTFVLPIDGQFTSAELLKETVVIRARNERGDTGALRMDGATQLELVRRHLSTPATALLDLDLTLGGNATSYLGAGWSAPEKDYTWSDGYDGYINSDISVELRPHFLRITAGAFIHAPSVLAQTMQIFINGVEVGREDFNEGQMQFREIKLDTSAFAKPGKLILHFHYSNPRCPRDLLGGNQDRRLLAFRFKKITLACPVLTAERL